MKTTKPRQTNVLPSDSAETEIKAFFQQGDNQIAARRKLAAALEQSVAEIYSPDMAMHVNRLVGNMLSMLPMTEKRAREAGESLAAIVAGIKMPRRAPSKEWMAFSESFVMMRHLAAMENAAHNPLLYTRYRTAGPLDWLKSAGKSVVTSEWFEYTTGFAKRCNSRSKSYVSQSYLAMKAKLGKISNIENSADNGNPEKFRLVMDFQGGRRNDVYENQITRYTEHYYNSRNDLEFTQTDLDMLSAEFELRRGTLRQRVIDMEKFLKDWSEHGHPRKAEGDEITLGELAENDKRWFGGSVLRLTEYIDTLYAEKNSELPSFTQSDTGARKFAAVALYLIGGAGFAASMNAVQQQSFYARLFEEAKTGLAQVEMAEAVQSSSQNLIYAVDSARLALSQGYLNFEEFAVLMREEYGITDASAYEEWAERAKNAENILSDTDTFAVTIVDDPAEQAKEIETTRETEKRLNLPYMDADKVYAARSGNVIENIAVSLETPKFRDLVPRVSVDKVVDMTRIAKTNPKILQKTVELNAMTREFNQYLLNGIGEEIAKSKKNYNDMLSGEAFRDSIPTSRAYAILMAEILKKHSPVVFAMDSSITYLGNRLGGPATINSVDMLFRTTWLDKARWVLGLTSTANSRFGGENGEDASSEQKAALDEASIYTFVPNLLGWAGWAADKTRSVTMYPGRWFMEDKEFEYHQTISANLSYYDDFASTAMFLFNLRQIGITDAYATFGLAFLNQMFLSTVTDVRIAIFWALVLFGGGRAVKSVLNRIKRTPGLQIGETNLSVISRFINWMGFPATAEALETIWQGGIVLLSPLSFGIILGMRLHDTYGVIVNTWPAIQMAISTASVIAPVTAVAAGSIGAFVFALRYFQKRTEGGRMPRFDGILSGVARVIKQRPDLTLYGIHVLCMMVQFGFTSIANKKIDEVLRMIYEGKDAALGPVFSAKNSVMAMLFMMGMAATHGFVDMRPGLRRIFGNEFSPYLTVTTASDGDDQQVRLVRNFLGLVIQHYNGAAQNEYSMANRLLNN
jgi:hypothetical protein